MDIKKLQALVVDALEDIKGQDIKVFDTTQITALFDRVAIASGTSNRQTKALAASVRDKVKEAGGEIVSIEGEDTGEWVLVDLGDMIVHIMQPAIRDYYRLEEIWGEKEVKMGAAVRKSAAKKAAGDEEAATAAKKAARKNAGATAAKLIAAEEAPEPKKPARKTAAKTATKTAAKSATKSAATKSAATKTAAKKTAAKKVPTGGVVKVGAPKAARKAPAKRAAKSSA